MKVATKTTIKNTGTHGWIIETLPSERTNGTPRADYASDTDVQAEEGQAKEGAWELFTG
jgi:hypothetical protein